MAIAVSTSRGSRWPTLVMGQHHRCRSLLSTPTWTCGVSRLADTRRRWWLTRWQCGEIGTHKQSSLGLVTSTQRQGNRRTTYWLHNWMTRGFAARRLTAASQTLWPARSMAGLVAVSTPWPVALFSCLRSGSTALVQRSLLKCQPPCVGLYARCTRW